MKPEKRQFIHDLLDDQRDARREAILLAGARVLRVRRWRRRVVQIFATVTVLGLVGISLQRMLTPEPAVVNIAAVPPAPKKPQSAVKSLTDAELLALFPDTPVVLATLGNGQKRLIFPRPGDAERFVSPL